VDEIWHRKDLIAPSTLLDLSRRSDTKGLRRVACHASVLLATGLLVRAAVGTPWLLVALFCHGVAIVSLFAPFHESVHYTAFRTRSLDNLVAAVCGAAIFLPATFYRLIHFHHHRHTQDPDQDPELIVPKPTTWVRYLLYITGIPLLLFLAATLMLNALGIPIRESDAVPRSARPAVVREARVHLALYAVLAGASIYTGSTVVLMYWLIPVVLAYSFLCMYLLAEHTGCPNTPDLLENTRTTITNPIVRFLMWNMPYHAEHHLFPSVPFHALPSLHEKLRGKFRHVGSGYAAFHRSFVSGLPKV
jgi:fatty acid desaturase